MGNCWIAVKTVLGFGILVVLMYYLVKLSFVF